MLHIDESSPRLHDRGNSQINMRSTVVQTCINAGRTTSSASNVNMWRQENDTKQEPCVVNSFVEWFQHHSTLSIVQHMPAMIKTLASLCQLLDDYPLSDTKVRQIRQAAIDSVLWSEDPSYPIAIDQNNQLNRMRQIVREFIHEFLEFAQQVLTANVASEQAHVYNETREMIKDCTGYLTMLSNY